MDLIPLTFLEPTELQQISQYSHEEIKNIDIDLMAMTKSQLINFSFSIFSEFQCEEVDYDILKIFVQVIAVNYADNKFHNLSHAVCVQQFTYVLLTKVSTIQFTPFESITLLICALCHDVGHPGVSNKFLNSTFNKLGILYGFQSTMERMHIATTLLIMSNSKYDFLKVSNDKKLEYYQKITEIILVTDLANAHKLADEIRHVPLSNITYSKVLLSMSDLSNEFRSDDISKKWSDAIYEEQLFESKLAAKWPMTHEEILKLRNTKLLIQTSFSETSKSQIFFLNTFVNAKLDYCVRTLPELQSFLKTKYALAIARYEKHQNK